MRKLISLRRAAVLVVPVVALVFASVAAAVVVTQNSAGWASNDTRPGGAVEFTEEYGAPAGLGEGALELTTDATTAAKADYWTFAHAGTALADVGELSYWTFQATAPQPPHAAASYQVQVDTNGAAEGGFTTLVYEPYWNGTVANGTWQQWDVDAGQLWSSRATECGLVAGAGGPPLYTLDQVAAMCPDAVVLGIGVNVGTFNPGYTVAVDGVQFGETTYDFEVGLRPASKEECKDDGWQTFDDPAFKNQGECVSFVESA